MESRAVRKAVIWGAGAFIVTIVHPVSITAGLVITVIASVIGALN